MCWGTGPYSVADGMDNHWWWSAVVLINVTDQAGNVHGIWSAPPVRQEMCLQYDHGGTTEAVLVLRGFCRT